MTKPPAFGAVAGCVLVTAGSAGDGAADRWRPFGHSATGRPLVVSAFGTPRVRGKLLVVGCIHGTECAGVPIVRRVLTLGCPPTNADVWAVPDLNPDGRRLGTRGNARGVDLNRNFAGGWRPIGARGDPQYAGPRPFSEPESRAARRLIRLVRPSVTIWYHQGQGPLVRAWGASVPSARHYARLARLPFRRMPWLAGTAPHWQNVAFPGSSSFVVELPDGRLNRRQVDQHAKAVMALARDRGRNAHEMRGSFQGGR
jgi:murein peptide amidase A